MTECIERDAGFCSGGDEDDVEADDDIHSPTDASEDSVDVKVQAISLKNKNKRKCLEPRRVDTLPAKKRKIEIQDCENQVCEKNRNHSNSSPFRPWSRSPAPQTLPHVILSDIFLRQPYPPARLPILVSPEYRPKHIESPSMRYPVDHIRVASPARFPNPEKVLQEEPLSLVSKKKANVPQSISVIQDRKLFNEHVKSESLPRWHKPSEFSYHPSEKVPNYVVVKSERDPEVLSSHIREKVKSREVSEFKPGLEDNRQNYDKFRIDSLLLQVKEEPTGSKTSELQNKKTSQTSQQRNYKNMTRERRIEANARERTRVHTISAAFDTLRRSVPAYSHNQKLSKLSVLRIACSYITTLSRLAGKDYSQDQSEPDLELCVDNVTKTIQTEGKLRKKKDD